MVLAGSSLPARLPAALLLQRCQVVGACLVHVLSAAMLLQFLDHV